MSLLTLSMYTGFSREATQRVWGDRPWNPWQISITGGSGTGKSMIAKMLAAYVGAQLYYSDGETPAIISGGTFMRTRAAELGFSTIDAFVTAIEDGSTPNPDANCDKWLIEQANSNPIAVFEGRLVRCWTPGAFQVYVRCSLEEAARRRAGPEGNVDAIRDELSQRDRRDTVRYERLYPGCMWRHDHFDHVCNNDAGVNLSNAVAEIILAHHAWMRGNHCRFCLD